MCFSCSNVLLRKVDEKVLLRGKRRLSQNYNHTAQDLTENVLQLLCLLSWISRKPAGARVANQLVEAERPCRILRYLKLRICLKGYTES
jgi:hypothetical protein